MIILLVLAAIIVLCGFLAFIMKFEGAWIAGILLSILLVGLLISIPFSHYVVKSEMAAFNAVEETVSRARTAGTNIESAAFQLEIARINKWLAVMQYWNSTIFDIWIPDKVDEFQPIR